MKTFLIRVAAEVTRLNCPHFPTRYAEEVRASLRRLLPFKPALTLAALCLMLLVRSAAGVESARAEHGMVASVHPLATAAGVKVLKSGGNAIDAAVAVGFTLGVVDTANSGIGGGCFMLIRLANGKFVGIDGREMAPTAATRDMFLRDGKGDTELSQTGALASGVPGEVAAFEYAVRKFGKKKLSELILPAAKLAEEGFELNGAYAARLNSIAMDMGKFDAARAIFFKGGKPLGKGEVLKQPELAATYRAIAGQGSDWFYRGPFAQATASWMRTNGGIMTTVDFANYHIALHEPVTTTYRGCKVVSFPPPSSGGVHVVEMLNILERFDLASLDEATRLHIIAEAMKLAFADRAHWLGDPDYAKVPRGLISKKYAASLAKRINLSRTIEVPSHGLPPGWENEYFKPAKGRAGSPLPADRSGADDGAHGVTRPTTREKHTTHFSVADAEGNWVACTATINTSFGSKVVIPGTGVVMNNQMDDFSVQPGVPNAFGLIGAEANAVAPSKRPLSSMSPTIVLKNGQPIIGLGAAGGPKIISTVLMELVAMLDLGMSPAEAVAAPRIHHQWSPGELMTEKSLPENLKTALEQRGHKLQELNALSVSHIVARTPDGKGFIGAADPRAGGNAAGW